MKIFIGVFLIWAFSGCATPGVYRIDEQNLSLGDIRRAVIGTIGEPRRLSENQRTYFSQYFSRKSDPKFDPQKSKERLYAKVIILGDQRPYDIQLEVVAEQLEGRTYSQVGKDASEAKRLGKELRSRLHQGLENRNVIDDFRAF